MFDTSLWEKIQEEKYKEKEKKRKEFLQKILINLRNYFSNKKVEEVYLIGSLTQEGMFSEFSDVDIAVKGLKEEFFKTICELEDLIERPIDLIEMEKCFFSERIKKEGIKIK